jgi:hypothetical protein
MSTETLIVYNWQVQFQGVTGLVAFDEHGYRKDYKLTVHELNLDNPVRKVSDRLIHNIGFEWLSD